MKYSDTNPPLQCFMNQSVWMKEALKNGTPIGVLWHDTAAGNPYIKRYVQPDDNAPNRQELLDILGVNTYHNDWNHSDREAGVNCFVGKLADETVSTVQVGPWTTHAWGCGGGPLGSCNGYDRTSGKTRWVEPFWIQFEICDDNYENNKGTKEYFLAVYQEACEITAYLCKKFDIDPKGVVTFAGITVPTILCHQDSYRLNLGSDHSDVLKWFKKYGYTMDKVREDVANLLKEEPRPDIQVGDLVSIKPGATWWSGATIPQWVFKENWWVSKITGDRVVLGQNERHNNSLNSPISIYNLTLVTRPQFLPVYYVRKAWEDKESQAGVFTNLSQAVAKCDEMGYGYSVYQDNGELKYSAPEPEPEPDPIPEPDPEPDIPTTPVEPDVPTDPVEPDVPVDPVEPEPEPEPEPQAPDPNTDDTEPTEKEINWFMRMIKAFLAAWRRIFPKKS